MGEHQILQQSKSSLMKITIEFMKRSEIDRYIDEARAFFAEHKFNLPEWISWSPQDWTANASKCDEIRFNRLGWDVTDFSSGNFSNEGLVLVTIRNGNVERDNKTYCEKIMMVREGQVTPIHFHWKKMEDIINRAGGELCIKLWKANEKEEMTDELFTIQIDGITIQVKPGIVIRLKPGQSISFKPYVYHTFWAENGHCMVGEVSTVNDDTNDNRFYEELGRYAEIEEDVSPKYVLCNEYTIVQ